MPKVSIDLDDIVDSTSNIELDFYFLKITGSFELPAKHTFLAITELDKYNVNGIRAIIDSLTQEERKQFDLLSNIDKYAFLNKYALVNNLGNLDSYNDLFIDAIASYKAKHINELLNNILMQIINNHTGDIIFTDFEQLALDTDDEALKEEYKSIVLPKQKELHNLRNEITQNPNINLVAFIIFTYYKSSYKKIYQSLGDSVRDFLLKLK